MVTGFIKDDKGYYYYLDEGSGILVLNQTLMINGVSYTFNSNGQASSNNQIINNGINSPAGIANNSQVGNNMQGSVYNNVSAGQAQVGVSPGTSMNFSSGIANQNIIGNNNATTNVIANTQLTPGSTTGPR